MTAKSLFWPQLHARNRSNFHLIIFIFDPHRVSTNPSKRRPTLVGITVNRSTAVVRGVFVGERFSGSCSSSSFPHLYDKQHSSMVLPLRV
ncbi:uncharacterized protein G2W53_001113 [Senna tora]|uniref:Uncharacterized protein n=1 Tax=Senna tora TaxID=362788 RepID=A0A834XFA2_9FABA|nr:uncharacterized protein G2W53_001113 [Senna tora]